MTRHDGTVSLWHRAKAKLRDMRCALRGGLCAALCAAQGWACAAGPTAEVADERWLRVTTSTTGAEPYEDGYLIVLDSGASRAIGISDSALLGPLDSGAHVIELRDIDVNCVPADDSSRRVVALPADTTRVVFAITCGPRVDQSNLIPDGNALNCGVPPLGIGSLAQSFRPSTSPLTKVVLRLRPTGFFPAGGYTTNLRLRAGAPGGTVLASAAVVLAHASSAAAREVTFAFAEPVVVSPHAIYVLEWESPAGGELAWVWDPSDTYTRGNLFGCGGDSTGYDASFATYR